MRSHVPVFSILVLLALAVVFYQPGQSEAETKNAGVPGVFKDTRVSEDDGYVSSSSLDEGLDGDGVRNEETSGMPTLLSSAVRMVVVLSVMVAGLLLVFYFVKPVLGRMGAGKRGKVIHIIANRYVGGKKVISLVSVADHLLVIGITPNNISLLTRIEDLETVEKLRSDQDHGYVAPSFAKQLKKFSRRFAGEDDARQKEREGYED